MRIKGITLQNLLNAEFIQFHRQILNQASEALTTATQTTTEKEALQQKLNALEALHRKRKDNPRTQTVEQLDQQRDTYIVSISKVLDGFQNHPNVSTQQAATALYNSLKVYGLGGIARQSYNAQTASLISLIKDWRDLPILVSAVQTLNLTEWLNALETTNTAFNTEYTLRTTEYAEANPQNLREVRLATHNVYYTYRDKIEANSILNPSEELTAYINHWNALIEQYNNTLNLRKSSSNTEDTTTEEGTNDDAGDAENPTLE